VTACEQSTTIRLVDQSPTPMPIAPLNIRKRSGASTVSRGANDDASGPTIPVRPYQGVRQELLAARTNENTASGVAPITISEKKEEGTIKKKKSLWFRRTPEEKEQKQQDNQTKSYTGGLQIPEAWQGLDDRIDKGSRVNPRKTKVSMPQHATTQSDDSNSTEFPMRNCGTASGKSDNTKERKGFFGLFGKKAKEDKGKRPMEIGCKKSLSTATEFQTDHWQLPTSVLRRSSLGTTSQKKLQALPCAVQKFTQIGSPASYISSQPVAFCASRSVVGRFVRIWFAYCEIGSALVSKMSTLTVILTLSMLGSTRTTVSMLQLF
jgi:hypothetical protein